MMRPTLYIALHFLTNRKKPLVLSLLGVICGVAIFICTQAQTAGFEEFFISEVLGTSGAVSMTNRFQKRYSNLLSQNDKSLVSVKKERRRFFEGITNANEIMREARKFSNVVACSPVVSGNATVRCGFENEVARLVGIDVLLHLQTTDLARQIIKGKLDDFRVQPAAVILGSGLANNINAEVGMNVDLLPTGGQTRRFIVAAIAQTGIAAIDDTRVYVDSAVGQSLLRTPGGVSSIIFKLRDPERAPAVAARFEELFQHRSRSWQEREEGNLQIFATLRISAAITVSLLILLAGFGIFNVMTMTVLAKVREIAILRSMGYERSDISAIFLWQGVLIAAIGSILGCGVGALMTWGVSNIPIKIRGILRTDHFLVSWQWQHYVFGCLTAFVAVFIASYFPARRAAFLPPVATLRGSGQ
jgi:lipoprotein-releasing system permease protein